MKLDKPAAIARRNQALARPVLTSDNCLFAILDPTTSLLSTRTWTLVGILTRTFSTGLTILPYPFPAALLKKVITPFLWVCKL